MATLQKEFDLPVGFSDHTIGAASAITATALGASIIEKHITLDAAGDGPDDKFSTNPEDFAYMVNQIRLAWASLGSAEVFFSPEEIQSRLLRPSLWITRNVERGELVSNDNVASLRPAGGLPPSEFAKVLGMRFSKAIEKGSPLGWGDLRADAH